METFTEDRPVAVRARWRVMEKNRWRGTVGASAALLVLWLAGMITTLQAGRIQWLRRSFTRFRLPVDSVNPVSAT